MNRIFALEIVSNHWALTINPMRLYVGKFKCERDHAYELSGKMKSGVIYEFLFFKLFVSK